MEIKVEITGITFSLDEARNVLLPALDMFTDNIMARTDGHELDFWESLACNLEARLKEGLRVKDGN